MRYAFPEDRPCTAAPNAQLASIDCPLYLICLTCVNKGEGEFFG